MIYIDLDDTLIRTRQLLPYRRTAQGRNFVANNPHAVNTQMIGDLREILRACEATVLTNSPRAYAHALLQKHNFPDMPIIGAADKPFCEVAEGSLIIGDDAKDVLAAHANRSASIGTAWGYSSAEQLQQAEPNVVIARPEDLEDLIIQYQNGLLTHQERQAPGEYAFMPEHHWQDAAPEIVRHALGTYIPPGEGMDPHSYDVLDHKRSKDHTIEEINNGAVSQFYHNRQVMGWKEFRNTLAPLYRRVNNHIRDWPESTLIAAPNSLPEYCYRLDINRRATMNMDSQHCPEVRIIHRVHPKTPAHAGNRGIQEHFRTIGVKDFAINTPRVVIFDDISTSGSQIEAIARILRWQGYEGEIYSVTLAQTRS